MLAHWIWLATRPGIGVRSALTLLRAFPNIETLFYAGREDYALTEGLDCKHLEALCDKSLAEANRILGDCTAKGIHVLTYQDAAYPNRLKHIPDPPLTLYYQGALPDFDAEPAVAVVGTRRASAYGCLTARRMGYQIAKCGGLVVSGLAGGVDTLAMKGALLAEQPVVGVLGNGLDVIYPRSNRDLYRDVACRGCLLSEFPPGTPPNGRNFPRRNRIISGLACGVVVVEAPAKSGALITAQLALDQGRDVFAVPGNVDAGCSAGSNGLLREGAIVAQHGWDVMEEYQALFPDKVHPWTGKTAPSSYPRELAELREPPFHFAQEAPPVSGISEKKIDNGDGRPYSESEELMSTLSDDERTVTSQLSDALRHVDDVIAGSGLPAARVLASLTLLEVKGLAVRHPGKFTLLPGSGTESSSMEDFMAKEPATNLVIVESPSKAKTIGKYLGPDYTVKACMGHLRDLPKSKMGVDLEHDFQPDYRPVPGKEEIIHDLKKSADHSELVYLATDPDREGEAISWHLKELLELPDPKVRRVTFNEITQNVVTSAIANPRNIDYDLVDAQQARRILDRIVGYQLSPLLWKKIRRGLSAGRVQSVATRLVVDRENEIRAFVPREYWSLDVTLDRLGKPGSFVARYHGEGKKRELANEAEVDEIIADITGKLFTVTGVKKAEKKRNAAPPFTTSTLQQEASRKLNMTPKRTMAIAQQLYEGVDVDGEGTLGLITYMRTDSLRLSEEAVEAAREFICHRYGEPYYYGKPHQFKTKAGAQDAHEAIRPTHVELDPEQIQSSLTKDQYRLYKLIWSRFLATQMANAVYDTVSIDTECAGHQFKSSHQSLRFPGFIAVYEEGKDEEGEAAGSPLPDLQEGDQASIRTLDKQQHFTQPPARYTEAMLVKAMEEKGVGRPSTYASIISTIQDRVYVIKKDKRLAPTPLGEVVNGLMMDRFNDIIDIEFTANMENRLDEVEEGKRHWQDVLRDFYQGFHQEMEEAEEALKDTRLKVPDEETDEVCELCGRNMVIKMGRFGRFMACPGYPECKNTKPIVERMPGRCPKCGSGMLKRKSKKGYAYYACEKGAECGFMTWDVPTEFDCPSCGHTMFKKSGRGRMKPFCIHEGCPNFLPEDQRGYRKKAKETEETGEAAAQAEAPAQETAPEEAPKQKTAKKPAAKKTGAAKTRKKTGEAQE